MSCNVGKCFRINPLSIIFFLLFLTTNQIYLPQIIIYFSIITALRVSFNIPVVQRKSKHPYLFQYKLSYRNETDTNHHVLLSTLIRCFKIFLMGLSTWGGVSTFIFFQCKPANFSTKSQNSSLKLPEKKFSQHF